MASDSKPAFLADYNTEEEHATQLGICAKIRHALKRDARGEPTSPIGRALDLIAGVQS